MYLYKICIYIHIHIHTHNIYIYIYIHVIHVVILINACVPPVATRSCWTWTSPGCHPLVPSCAIPAVTRMAFAAVSIRSPMRTLEAVHLTDEWRANFFGSWWCLGLRCSNNILWKANGFVDFLILDSTFRGLMAVRKLAISHVWYRVEKALSVVKDMVSATTSEAQGYDCTPGPFSFNTCLIGSWRFTTNPWASSTLNMNTCYETSRSSSPDMDFTSLESYFVRCNWIHVGLPNLVTTTSP